MLTPPEHSPDTTSVPSVTPREECGPPTKPSSLEPTPLKLPPILPVNSPALELPSDFISMFERGLAALCTEHPAAGLRILRYLPVSFATKHRVAEAIFADARLSNVLRFLPLLKLPAAINQNILDAVIMRTICKPDGPTSFWNAIDLKLNEPLPPEDRAALALHCVAYDVATAVENVASFRLDTPEVKLLFTRSCLERLDVSVIRKLPWFPQLGREAPQSVSEIAERCIADSPLKAVAVLDTFGLPVVSLVERVLPCARGQARWKAIEALCARPDMTEAIRAAIALDSFETFPHETLRRLESFRLGEGDTVRQILLQGVTILPGAVISYLQDHASPLYRDVAEQTLWSRIAGAPWDSAEIALKAGVQDQQLLSAILEDTFKRDPNRTLRYIDVNKNISQSTLSRLVERLTSIDAPAVMRGLKRFGPVSRDTFIRIALECAKAAPEKAFELLADERLREPSLHRQLLLAMAGTRRGVEIIVQNLRRALLSQHEERKEVALRCLGTNAERVLPALGIFSLSERAHAEVAAHCSNGSPKKLRDLLSTLGVYSPEACSGLIPDEVIITTLPKHDNKSFEAARTKARTHPGEVATKIRSYGLVNEDDRLAIALQCLARAPRRVAENLLSFGLYSDSARRSLASAMAEASPDKIPEIISLCGVTKSEDVLALLAPLASSRPQRLRDLSYLLPKDLPIRFWAQAFSECVSKESWANALALSRVLAETKLDREPRQSEVLNAFDTLVAEVGKFPELPQEVRYTLSLIERVRRAGTVPDRALLRAFSIFDERGDAFIIEVLQQAGPTSGPNIVDELSRLYRRKKTIPPQDQQIIREFIAAGFRGFSRLTLTAARQAFARSPEEGRKLIASWQEISKSILRGRGVEANVEEDGMYPSLVYEAYRPVGLSVKEVREQLTSVSDWTSHLAPFTYPDDGYPMALVELEEVRLRPGEAVDLGALRATATFIADTLNSQNTCSHEEFIQILVKASQRGIDSINKHKLTQFLAGNYPDPRLAAAARALKELPPDSISPQRAVEAINQMREFFDVVYGDMLDVSLRAYFEGGKLPLRDQFKNRVRNILRIPLERELSVTQIREAVRAELDKVWRPERTILSRESRKFVNDVGAMSADYRMYVTKSRASFFGRAGAGLCTSDDTWSWDQADFLQMIMVDERKGHIVGNVQLHIFDAPDKNRAVLARLNPTEKFLMSVSGKTLAREMLRCFETFADDNNLVPYLPHDGDHLHLLTNRESFAPFLKARYGEEFERSIKVASWLTVTSIYRLTREPR